MRIASGVMATVILAGAALSIMEWATPKDWKGRPSLWGKGEQVQPQPEKPTGGSGGSLVNVIEENGIALMSAVIPAADYEANGVSAQADSAYTLTAEVYPSNTTYKELLWTTAWSTSGGWAEGKEVSDYVTVTPSEDTLSATVACAAPFAVQIQIAVTYKHDTEVNASCTVDYRQKYLDAYTGYIALDTKSGKKANFASGQDTRISIDFPFAAQSDFAKLGTNNGEISVTPSANDVYTLPMECKLTSVEMQISSDMSRGFAEYPAGCNTASGNLTATGVTYTGMKCTGLMKTFMGITDWSRANLYTIKSKLGSFYDAYYDWTIRFTVNGEEKSVSGRLSFGKDSLAVAASNVNLSSGSIIF